LKQDAFNLARDQFAPELLLLDQNMKSQDSITTIAKASMEDKRKQFEQTAMANMGFLERNKALADLSAEEGSVLWASWLISLLIILIEIGPGVIKINDATWDLMILHWQKKNYCTWQMKKVR
jgi:hypothetical protein